MTMTTIKAYTDLEQSRKLAEILPLKSADTYIGNFVGESGKVDGTNVHYYPRGESFGAPEIIYAWSLSALLNVIPNYKLSSEHNYHTCTAETSFGKETVAWFDNPVDACVAMIERLYKLNLL